MEDRDAERRGSRCLQVNILSSPCLTLESATTLLQTYLSAANLLHELGLKLQIFSYHGATGPLLGFGGFLRLWLRDSAADGGLFLRRIGLRGPARRPGGHHGCLLTSGCLLQSQKVTGTLDSSIRALENGEQRSQGCCHVLKMWSERGDESHDGLARKRQKLR